MDGTDEEELRSLLAHYQEAIRGGSLREIVAFFHPEATVAYPEDGRLVTCSAIDFAREVADLLQQGVTVDERTRHLDALISYPIAVLRVDFDLQIGEAMHEGTDFYTLVRLGEAWTCTRKIYNMVQTQ